MSSQNLTTTLNYLSASGYTLNLEHRAALQSSLPLLKKNLKLSTVTFWGKILTSSGADYLIAQGYQADTFAQKKNFVSHDGVDWVQLPEIDAATAALADQVRGRFTGDASHENIIYTDDGSGSAAAAEAPNPDETGGEEGEDAPKPDRPFVTVTEEKRLVHVIQQIDHDTSVVPRGAFTLTAEAKVVPNSTFQGLLANEAERLASYGHLRPAERLPRKTLLEREHLSKSLDFLDTIDEDIPRGSWTVRRDPTTNVVTVRSLLWPGSFAFHVAHSPSFGYAYFGFGEKNNDIGFAL